MARLTIHATVDDADLQQFVGLDELDLSFDARLTEVYGDDGTLLTTIRVESVDIDGDGIDARRISR